MSMFARLTRLPLRRCLHTAPSRQTRSYRYFAAGATASLAATYLTWHLTSEGRRIALDSDPKSHDSPSEQASHSSSSGAGEDAPPGEDAASGGAFNPVTGEINWDCPCLGGMAHGPCGEQFREAFSCFVFSEEEPKGINCVDKFKAMQNCFREHPDVYGDEIMDDDEEEETAPAPAGVAASTSDVDSAQNPDTISSKGTTPQPSQKTTGASVTP